ncbi:MAG TPA: hypothetical protein VLN25_06400, partial [Burkholderiaceae bacterium]|nr:hypothetical protein [Burkholderiaceae bacterium]
MRVVRRVGWGGLTLALLVLTGVLWYRQASQPIHEGTVRVDGIAGRIEVRRDEQGIPTIVASSEHD